jgi:F-type H+-transporting ATPase subunit gamma
MLPMSKLIQLRQRSKAIETIKKITHAMRLISMSTHSHLQRLQDSLTKYTHEIDLLFAQLMSYAPTWRNPIIHPEEDMPPNTAVILIGSQKGLCGSFNTLLFKLFTKAMATRNDPQFDLITVGQKAIDFSKTYERGKLKQTYAKFTAHRLISIAREITHIIIHAEPHYSSIIIFSNFSQSFFTQKPHITTIIPITPIENPDTTDKNEFSWEESPEALLDDLLPQYIESQLQHALFQSLVAEHAARFISMDSATRNAKELLEANNLEYNKLRQAKITKELSELIGSYK